MVRSSRIIVDKETATGQHNIYTAPAGKVVLIKSIAAYNSGGGTMTYSVGAVDSVSGFRVDWVGRYTANPLASNESETELGWWVLEPADVFFVNLISGGPISIWVSGAVLS